MHYTRLFFLTLFSCLQLALFAQIDMQAHVASDEGRDAYDEHIEKQRAYYTGNYSYANLIKLTNDDLFGALNTQMETECKHTKTNGYSYDDLRDVYVNVDRDLNNPGQIILYYSGETHTGVWDKGATWNREHTWPQSKGAYPEDGPINWDMQSVRPANSKLNSGRGNTAYGEGDGFYDPDDNIKINNP